MDKNDSEDRLIHNEQLLRDKNTHAKDGLKKYFRRDKAVRTTPIEFACECSDLECHEQIKASIDTYEKLHKRRDHFIISKGHETPKIEKIVASNAEFDVVEKPKLTN